MLIIFHMFFHTYHFPYTFPSKIGAFIHHYPFFFPSWIPFSHPRHRLRITQIVEKTSSWDKATAVTRPRSQRESEGIFVMNFTNFCLLKGMLYYVYIYMLSMDRTYICECGHNVYIYIHIFTYTICRVQD